MQQECGGQSYFWKCYTKIFLAARNQSDDFAANNDEQSSEVNKRTGTKYTDESDADEDMENVDERDRYGDENREEQKSDDEQYADSKCDEKNEEADDDIMESLMSNTLDHEENSSDGCDEEEKGTNTDEKDAVDQIKVSEHFVAT